MTRITVDINDEWLETARDALGTETTVDTINEALRSFALKKQAADHIAALDSVQFDFAGAERAWRFGGGRSYDELVEEARSTESA